jgi:hypothetical protein
VPEERCARRALLEICYHGVDISAEIERHLVDFSYTDNAHGKADDLSLRLEDRDGRWRGPWFPSKGATISARIVTKNWSGDGQSAAMPCGVFEIDEIEVDGPPSQVTVKAVSTFVSKPMRQQQRTQAWERISLSGIAEEIAGRNGLVPVWDSRLDPYFERRDQVEQSDLGFLQGLCEDYGIGLKVVDGKLACYNEADYEAAVPVDTVRFGEPRILSYRFRHKCRDVYKGAKVQYHDHLKDKLFEVYAVGNAEGSGSDLKINQKADNLGDARILAQKKLRDANKHETTASLELMGDLRKSAGKTIQVAGFGRFDGRWFMEKVEHSVSRGGYRTSLGLRKAGDGG